MSDLVPFLVVGVAGGSLYGLAAVGLVLTYKTSGVFNFAHGAVAAAAAYLFYELHQQRGLPWPVAAAVSVLMVGLTAALLLEWLSRSLARAGTATAIVATVGVLLVVQGLVTAVYGPQGRFFDPFLAPGSVRVLGADVGVDQLITIVIATAATTALALFFGRSRLGATMRGVVDDPDLVALTGAEPTRVRRQAWLIGSTFAAASGILLAPTIGLDVVLLTFLVVQAFGAAAIGRFSSLPLTYLGGIGIGVLASVITKELGHVRFLAGLPAGLPFVVLFVVLLATPRRLNEGHRRGAVRSRSTVSPVARRGIAVIGLAAVLAIPGVVGPRLPVYANGAVFVVVFLSLALLVNLSGQVSLCHAAFTALGATTFSHLAHGVGVPWAAALLGAGAVCVPLGVLIAVPAVRLSGLYLALATFGLGLVLERMMYSTAAMFGGLGTRLGPRPAGFTSDRAFYYVIVCIAVGAALLVAALERNRLGRLLRGVADSPLALETLGTSVMVARVVVFAASAFLAGVAGSLFAALGGSVSGVAFTPLHSLLWLAVLVIGGRGLVGTAIAAAFALAVVPSYATGALGNHQTLVFGVVATVTAVVHSGPFELGAFARRAAEGVAWRRQRSPVTARLRPARSQLQRTALG